ncbi:MAG: hypothetical protein J1E39_03515 [Eubacterium sp.]|nr:hypothetical protein [Eubacterium sp.]
MSKSVYSLVLSDDIVRAVDSLAYKMNTSRSGLIDRILAERLAVQTPETRMRSIMESISRFFDEDIFLLQQASDGGMLIKSPLSFKYKPTIRYAVDVFARGEEFGRLRVSFRTQNAMLTMLIGRFWRMFVNIEAKYLAGIFETEYELDGDRLSRTLHSPVKSDGGEITAEQAAQAIADYVRFLDKQIKIYFENTDNEERAAALIDAAYRDRMKSAKVLL